MCFARGFHAVERACAAGKGRVEKKINYFTSKKTISVEFGMVSRLARLVQ